MPIHSLQRWLRSSSPTNSRHTRAESRPPVLRDGWQGRPAKAVQLASARLDFADALIGVHNAAAASALDRIAIARSLHELWHLREEVFSLIACRFDQDEATRRLAGLDRHFPRRTMQSGLALLTRR